MGTKSMWEDVNTKTLQGALFIIFRSDIMGVTFEYNSGVERRHTHPLILPLIETDIVSFPDGDILEKMAVVVPVNKLAKPGSGDRKRTIQGAVGEMKECVGRAQVWTGFQTPLESGWCRLSGLLQGPT